MPLLISLQATVSLARWDGASVVSRVFPIEQLYLGYRKNVLLPDEVVTHIHVPAPVEGEFSRVYKVSKRFEDDISAVCLAIQVRLVAGSVAGVYIGVGGVAAVPARAHQTEASLNGQPWNESSLAAAKTAIQSEFQPISDMRASKAYRQTVLGQLLERFWLETQGKAIVTLDDLAVLEVRA
jgi:xanthine dehydrogenase small subunit